MLHRFFRLIRRAPGAAGCVPAFTMIELVIVISLMGVMAMMMVPRFTNRDPETQWPAVLDGFNRMIDFARQEAIAKQKTHRIVFVSHAQEPDQVLIEREARDADKPNKVLFKPLNSPYFKGVYTLPKQVKINAVFQNGVDQLQERASKRRAYCHVINEGLVEDTLVHLTRLPASRGEEESMVSFKMVPFFGRFEQFPTHVKPEK